MLDLRALAAASETVLLRPESFLARARGAGVVVELLLAAAEGPGRLLHFAASTLGELDPEFCAERAVETVLLVARGSSLTARYVDVVAGPSVAAELVAALAREMVRCRLSGAHHLARAHVSPAWHLMDARAGPAGLLPLPFDAEGLPSRAIPLLAGGRRFEAPLAWAPSLVRGAPAGGAVRPSYRTPPVSAPANLVVLAEEPQPLQELLYRLQDGLYLAVPAAGVRLDERHSRFTLPCAAVTIAGGKPVAACPLVEIRGSFRRLLGALEGCGAETESFALICAVTTPSLLLRRLELG
jgi:predicted Zn-dependent protease